MKPVSEYPKGWQVVGENGPELTNLRGGEKIMSWEELTNLLHKDNDEPNNT